jgi:hypothetical protein
MARRPAAVLGRFSEPAGSSKSIGPADSAPTVTLRYRGDILMLETHFDTTEGGVTLIDFAYVPMARATSSASRGAVDVCR